MDDDEPATCPLCGDERPNTKSVEQHISACTDAAHKGEHGPDHRDEIEDGGPATIARPEGSESRPPNGGPHSEAHDGGDREDDEIPLPFTEGWKEEVTSGEDAGDVEDDRGDEGGGGSSIMGVVMVMVLVGLATALTPPSSTTDPRHPFR